MKVKMNLAVSLLIIVAAVFIIGCSESSVSGPEETAQAAGIYVDDIQWVSAKPEFITKMTALKKKVKEEKLITVVNGGAVGGEYTFNNSVMFPPNALTEDTKVSVEVKYNDKGIVYVEFLPSGSFNEFVEMTLSWEYLDIDEPSIADLNIYFSQDDGSYWFLLDSGATIDYDAKTVTFKIDHFTRFGWGI